LKCGRLETLGLNLTQKLGTKNDYKMSKAMSLAFNKKSLAIGKKIEKT